MWDRFLEVHLSSSRGRFARSFKLSRPLLIFIISIIGLLFIFLLVSSILFFSQKTSKISNKETSKIQLVFAYHYKSFANNKPVYWNSTVIKHTKIIEFQQNTGNLCLVLTEKNS